MTGNNLISMINKYLRLYEASWKELVAARISQDFFRELQPTAAAWKVKDRDQHDQYVETLRPLCTSISSFWANDRWLTALVLKGHSCLSLNIGILMIVERRPGVEDPVGLDHIDWWSPAVTQASHLLPLEKDLNWTYETGRATWISVRWDGWKAKLRAGTVLDSYIRDLRLARDRAFGPAEAIG
jgi:hypothetical protein